jgi:hypothetical protein
VLFERRRGFGCSLLVESGTTGAELRAVVFRKVRDHRLHLSQTTFAHVSMCWVELRKSNRERRKWWVLVLAGQEVGVALQEAETLRRAYGVPIRKVAP